MRKSLLVATAALALVGYAVAQATPPANPETTSPSVTQDKGTTQPQSGTAQQPQQTQQSNPISPEGAERSRNPQRGEDVGEQDEHVPVAGQQPAQGTDEANLPPNTPILAELTKKVDVKKAKEGDQVVARVVQDVLKDGNVVIPHGARLIGKVTLAQPAGKGSKQSQLAIAWERVELRNGEPLALHANIQALAPRPQGSENAPMTGMPSAQSGGPYGAPQGPMGQPGGGTAGTMGAPGGPPSAGGPPDIGGVGSQTGENPTTMPTSGQRAGGPVLNARSSGVQGMPGVTLSPQPNPAQGSILRDDRGNLKLESGTQLVLRVVAP